LEEERVDYVGVDKMSNSDSELPIQVIDLLDADLVTEVFEGFDAVIHLANHPHWRVASPQRVLNENVSMNMNVFQASVDLKMDRIVYASTIQAVSGEIADENRERQPLAMRYFPADSDSPLQPRNPYSLSKALSERMLDYFSEIHGMDCVSIRFPWLLSGKTLQLVRKELGESKNPYDAFAYLPVESAAQLAWLCVKSKTIGHRSYFPAAKDTFSNMTVREIATELLEGVEMKRNPDEMDCLVDCSVIEKETGWIQP